MHDRQYTRVDTIRNYLDDMLKGLADKETARNGYVHLYGVGQAAAMIALKRGYSREVAELAVIAGMLHDWCKYERNIDDDHAYISAKDARAVLEKAGCFTAEEMDRIETAIYKHSDKSAIDSDFDEILKDADTLQHVLRNPVEDYWHVKPRALKLFEEFELSGVE